jgi:hypothetical protein
MTQTYILQAATKITLPAAAQKQTQSNPISSPACPTGASYPRKIGVHSTPYGKEPADKSGQAAHNDSAGHFRAKIKGHRLATMTQEKKM